MTRLGDWTTSETRTLERARYSCPEDVFEQNYDRLVRALTIVAGDRETAADAVQEAFVRLVRNWDRISAYEDPAGWVRKVALNQVYDHRRSVWRQARLLLRMRQQYATPLGAFAGDGAVWERLQTLPVKQRTAIALYYVDGLTAREVAETMQVSEGTVKQHLHRGRETLRGSMRGQRDE